MTSNSNASGTGDDPERVRQNDFRALLLGNEGFDQHYDAQQADPNSYAATLIVLENNGVKLPQNVRVKVLAAAWARRDKVLADSMLHNRAKYGLVVVTKALRFLDSGRQIRVIERRMKSLKKKRRVKNKQMELRKLKSELDSLNKNKPKIGSANGAVCRHVRRWVRNIPKEELEFFALRYPREPWANLANICHFNPTEDFAALPWFMSFCFGEPPPEDSIVHCCSDINIGNVNNLVANYALPYACIKTYIHSLTDTSKGQVARHDRFTQVIWNYQILQSDPVDEVIRERVECGEEPSLPYVKLMDVLYDLKQKDRSVPYRALLPVARKKLSETNWGLEPPVVVMGDRSPSMGVAIRASTIIACILMVTTNAKLVFFDSENSEPPFIPRSIEDVFDLADSINTRGTTIPAVSLLPFYLQKEVIKTFIIVTDEGENDTCLVSSPDNRVHEQCSFSRLFKKYYDEVYPAQLVFISFLGQNEEGRMVNDLKNRGLDALQVKFDNSKPNLTKVSTLLSKLASQSEYFHEQVKMVKKRFDIDGLDKVFADMRTDPSKILPSVIKQEDIPPLQASGPRMENIGIQCNFLEDNPTPEPPPQNNNSRICTMM